VSIRHAGLSVRVQLFMTLALLSMITQPRAATIDAPCTNGVGDVSALTAAIDTANNETTNPGLDTITLAGGCTYTIGAVDNWWYGPNGLPAISSTIVIEGNGSTISGMDASLPARPARLFYISGGWSGLPPGNLFLHNLNLTNGVARGGNTFQGGGGAGMGGAIFNQGMLTLSAVNLADNHAIGGDIDVSGLGGGGGGLGQDAIGIAGGGGFGGPFGPAGSSGGAGGSAGGGGGGAGFGSTGSSGINSNGGNGGGNSGWGGDGGTPLVSGKAGSGGDGGGGGGTPTAQGDGAAGGDFGFGGQDISVFGIAGGGGGVGGGGGRGDLSPGGGGGFGGGGGAGGAAGFGGGGQGGFGGGRPTTGFQGGGGGAGMGGAIFNQNGNLTLINCTLTRNNAQGGSGAGPRGAGLGGGIFNLQGAVTIIQSTLAFNSATFGNGSTGPDGGAVYNIGYLAGDNDGVLHHTSSVVLINSILADSTNGDGTDPTHVADLANVSPATIGSGATNIATASVSADSHSIVVGFHDDHAMTLPAMTADPLLGPLQSNGGLMQTMALQPTSPALDAGTRCISDLPATDERGAGFPRTWGTAPDIGAFEHGDPASGDVIFHGVFEGENCGP